MKDGIKTKWTGKANKGIAAHEVFFLWPFIMGSYSGSTHLNLTKVQTAETRKYFIDMIWIFERATLVRLKGSC